MPGQVQSVAVGRAARGPSTARYPSLWRNLEGCWVPGQVPTTAGKYLEMARGKHANCSGTTATFTAHTLPRGPVIDLSGTSSRIDAPAYDKRYSKTTSGWTASVWVRLDAFPGTFKYPNIMGQADDFRGWGLYFDGDWSRVVGFYGSEPNVNIVYASAANTSASSWAPPLNVWMHLCLRKRRNSFALYRDGAIVSENTAATFDQTAASGAFNPMRWGVHYSGNSLYGYLNGAIGESAYWSRPLSDLDIRLIASGASPLTPKRRTLFGRSGASTGATQSAVNLVFSRF